MRDKLNQFISKVHAGDYNSNHTPDVVEVNDPSNYAQCMDLAYAWLDFLGITRDAIRSYYAYQIWTEANDAGVKFFEFIPNTPSGIPPAGAVVVFSNKVGIAGHVSLATGDGDLNLFKSFDQNWGTNKLCRLVDHKYDYVLGWLVVRETSTGGVTDQSLYDFGQDYGILELQAGRSKLQDQKNQINALNSKINNARNALS